MSKKSRVVLLPLIASISFVFSFWILEVRKAQEFSGISNDVAGGAVLGLGIGVMLVLLATVQNKKQGSF
ncbi:hypothetical protein K0I73_16255 [Shewanella mesophila]|uniref:hypothetical protein n=1 Tax=Shewanella mesophila TaxID=2864208 RepID=UPI001C65F662|nr:hypothetical protein [Shewanella mesophila]QYJ85713.1 hypothetical protein K0I73_16255 [Shewanella mesophila]